MRKKNIRDYLKNKIPNEIINQINRSFEIIGDIAITEIKEEHLEFEKEIGDAIMKINPSIKTVLRKEGTHGGEFRTQKLKYISGENKKETIYQENGIKLLLNPETVYFSPRLSTERGELLSQTKDNQRVLIMFSGCGPYSFVALKKNPNLMRITSIELNPEGHKYALKNIKLNKNLILKSNRYKEIKHFIKENQIKIYHKDIIKNINEITYNFINGDVKEEIPKLKLEEEKSNKIEEINFDNKIFSKKSIHEILENIKDNIEKNKEIIIDFDILSDKETKLIKNLLTIFFKEIKIIAKIENKIYNPNNKYQKIILINFLENLENNKKNTIQEITKYDQIFMPLPKDAEQFLDSAFECVTKDGIIHLYGFLHENDFPHVIENSVIQAGKKHLREIEILQTRKVGQYAPGKYRVCCDFKVLE